MSRRGGDGISWRAPNFLRQEPLITAALAVDRIDRKILGLLQVQGRISNQALAAEVGLSASACLARVKRLETQGLILGYHAQLALDRLGPTVTIFAEVTLSQHHPDDFRRFERFVDAAPEVVESSQVSGPFDYLLKVTVQDMSAWRDLSDRILQSNLGIAKISSHVLMKTTKAVQPAVS